MDIRLTGGVPPRNVSSITFVCVVLLAVTRPFTLPSSVLTFHCPAFFVATVAVSLFLYRGRIERLDGVILALVYLVRWVGGYVIF